MAILFEEIHFSPNVIWDVSFTPMPRLRHIQKPGKLFNVKVKQYKLCQNEHLPEYVILEGFRQNGLQIRNQRIFLHIVAPVKIDF